MSFANTVNFLVLSPTADSPCSVASTKLDTLTASVLRGSLWLSHPSFCLVHECFCIIRNLVGGYFKRNCSSVSSPYLCTIICLCWLNLPLEIQDLVASSLLSLTFPELSFVSVPLTVFLNLIIIKQPFCDRLLFPIFILINFIFTCIILISNIFRTVFRRWVIRRDRFSLVESSSESECDGLFAGILFAPRCLSLSLGRDVPDALAWSLSK